MLDVLRLWMLLGKLIDRQTRRIRMRNHHLRLDRRVRFDHVVDFEFHFSEVVFAVFIAVRGRTTTGCFDPARRHVQLAVVVFNDRADVREVFHPDASLDIRYSGGWIKLKNSTDGRRIFIRDQPNLFDPAFCRLRVFGTDNNGNRRCIVGRRGRKQFDDFGVLIKRDLTIAEHGFLDRRPNDALGGIDGGVFVGAGIVAHRNYDCQRPKQEAKSCFH